MIVVSRNCLHSLRTYYPKATQSLRPFMRQNRSSVHEVWRWRKFISARMIAFYIVDLSTKTSRNALFLDSIDSIVEKTVVMMRTTTETEENAGLKRYFSTFVSFLV
jgi:hypothetical protein